MSERGSSLLINEIGVPKVIELSTEKEKRN